MNKPKITSRNPVIDFDYIRMFFGEPYVIDLENARGTITVKIPSIINMVNLGYKRFCNTLNVFTTNTTAYRLILWDAGIDWNETSDFELFIMLFKQIDQEAADLLFENLQFSKFELVKNSEDKIVLYNQEDDIEINEEVYFHISQYLRKAFNDYPEEKLTKDKTLKTMYINKDRSHLKAEEAKNPEERKSAESQLLSLISSCLNHPGFKYNLEEMRTMNVCQFFDSVQRLQIYESTTALMKGMYSGFMDCSKIDSDSYNFMRVI